MVAMIGKNFLPLILRGLLTAFLRRRPGFRTALGLFLLLIGAGVWIALSQGTGCLSRPSQPSADGTSSHPFGTGSNPVVFCLWNLENLFDDVDDKRRYPDEEYDSWFVSDPVTRTTKYRRLAESLAALNCGRGPDILVGNEVESYRAAALLRESMNARLPAGATPFEHVGMKELDAGRHIAPCVISRYPISRMKLLGKRQRILEFHLTVNGHDLHIIASHWTSQISDKGEDPTRGRNAYASTIYSAYCEAIRANPDADLLVAGDFNDVPGSASVAGTLNVTGNRGEVLPGVTPPKLYGLLSKKSTADFATMVFNGKSYIYDQIAISPGLLDSRGWTCEVDSVAVPTKGLMRPGTQGRRPWRFGSRNDDANGRGYSDHFPVVVTLNVAP